ncbi:MAG: ATP synthase subunit I [Myxococcota bacterium]
MNDKVAKQVMKFVAVAAVALTLVAGAIGGADIGIGAAVGGAVAWLDALVLLKLTQRITSGRVGSQRLAAVLLGVKLALLGAVCWGLLARWGVNPIGFGVGFSAMVLGVLYAAVELTADDSADDQEHAMENG